ncbi:MAG: 50S ribosomal protein L29 [Patescibacteria group bacterium]
MKRRVFQEYKEKPMPELEKELKTLKERMVSLKIDLATGKVKSLKEMKEIKKSIAQFETLLNERARKQI